MAIYTIIRVYEMPAENLQQAVDRMAEAIVLPGAKPGQGKQVHLRPGASWLALALEQLGVKRKK